MVSRQQLRIALGSEDWQPLLCTRCLKSQVLGSSLARGICSLPSQMAKQQKPRAQSLRVNGRNIRVSPCSDLSPSTIKLMVEHKAALAERVGEEYHLRGGYTAPIQNKALKAAFRAKGLIH